MIGDAALQAAGCATNFGINGRKRIAVAMEAKALVRLPITEP
jgi:hypothetical protein